MNYSAVQVLGPPHWICIGKAHDFGLTAEEIDVLGRLYLRTEDLIIDLDIKENDLKSRLKNLFEKFEVSTRLGLIARANLLGIVGVGSPPADDVNPLAGSLVPRKPLPSNGEGEIALRLPEQEDDAQL